MISFVAQHALEIGNYTEILGKEINLTRFNPGGIKEKIANNVFVKNLTPKTKSANLHAYFKKFGPLFSCKVKYEANGECKGYGYVCFEAADDAAKAVAQANGDIVDGTKLEVYSFRTRENRNSSFTVYNNLYVKNVPKKYKNEDLATLFGRFGEIVSAVVIKDKPDSEENRGFGFVCFKNTEDAKKAEESLKIMEIDGQRLFVCRALTQEVRKKQLKEERLRAYKDCNLYVKRFKEDVTDEMLRKAFEEFGTVVSARVMTTSAVNVATGLPEQKTLGFGFVCFSSQENAKRALEAAQTRPILGQMLYVAIAEKKEDRTARYKRVGNHRYQAAYPMQMGYPPRSRVPYVCFVLYNNRTTREDRIIRR